MEPLYRYYLAVLGQERAEFVTHHRGLFVLRAPPDDADNAPEYQRDDEEITNIVHAWRDTNARDLARASDAGEWQVGEVRKRPGYPPYNRVVVGRSQVCDLVIPFAGVSKMHAHFHVEGVTTTALEDRGSRNGTTLNGVAVEPMKPVAVKPGDRVQLAGVELQLMTASDLYVFLTEHAPGAT